jgi:HK97 family phage portal protein
MNLFDKALSKFGYEKSIGPLPGDSVIHKSLRQLLSLFSTSSVKFPYKESVWVYACINAITENLSRVPFKLRKDAGNLEPDTIETGDLYELFQRPNPLMNCFDDLIKATFIFYLLRGEAFWIFEGRDDITKVPKEIWTFDPVRFEEVCDKKTGILLGWKYKGLTDTFFSTNEVIHFKMFNPYNDIRGLSPLEAAKLSVDQNYQSSIYNKAFFENGATVGGFISVPDELSDEAFNRLVKQFEDRHKGAGKAHKIAVVEGGGKFTPARMTQKDMEFIDGKKMTKEEILAVYKVNEVVLGCFANIKSYEGIKSAHKAFWEECLVPKLLYFENVLWIKLFSMIGQRRGKGRVWGQFDTATVGPLQVNYQEKIKVAKDMFFMGWPINHINKRLELGMKDVPWGDEWWVPGGYSSVNALPRTPPTKEPEKDDNEDSKKSLALMKFYCEPIESDFMNKFKKLLFETRKRAIASSFSHAGWDNVVSEKEITKLKQSLEQVYLMSVNCGISAVRSEVDVNPLRWTNECSSFGSERASFVTTNFKVLLDNVVKNLSLENSKDDKIREVFNLLANKVGNLAKQEAEDSFIYGQKLVLNYVREEIAPTLMLE